jgi:SAM-dependent methyltransferase
VTAAAHPDRLQVSAVGGRTLEVLSETPRLNRWLYSKLAPHVRGDVLEIGSGIGNLSSLLVADGERFVLSDMESHYLDALRRRFAGDARVEVVGYDLEAPPPAALAGRRFDTIVAVNVIEHIADDRALVGHLAAMLKPGGKLAVYVPACPFAYGTLDRALGHHRRYTPASLKALLDGADLRSSHPKYINLFGLAGWMVSGRLLRRERLGSWPMVVFESLMPFFRLEDLVRLPVGLGVYAVAER